ncbi:hypothetical protein ACF06D_13860 [Streptomyces griseoluteus]
MLHEMVVNTVTPLCRSRARADAQIQHLSADAALHMADARTHDG